MDYYVLPVPFFRTPALSALFYLPIPVLCSIKSGALTSEGALPGYIGINPNSCVCHLPSAVCLEEEGASGFRFPDSGLRTSPVGHFSRDME